MRTNVIEVMTSGIEKVSAAATLEYAAKLMKDHNVGFLPVVDGEYVVGVITDRDIVLRAVSERLRPEMTRVGQVMTPGAIVCYSDQDIAEASLIMEKHLVHRLVVLDRNEKLRGIVSLSDVAARAKREALSGRVLGEVGAA